MVRDLAEKYERLTDLYAEAASARDEAKFALTEDQIRFFAANGYVSGIEVLGERQIEALLDELDGLMRPDHPGHDRRADRRQDRRRASRRPQDRASLRD